MPDKERVRRAAQTVITRCLALPAGSNLAIVADETTLPVARALAEAAEALEHRTLLLFFSAKVQQSLGDKPLAEPLLSVFRDTAGVILCVNSSAACLPFRDHVRRSAWDHSRRVAHMPGASWRTLLAADADYDRLTQVCRLLALALVKGSQIQITSFDRQGQAHVLRANLSPWRRMPIISDGIVPEGAWGNVPSGETYIAPLEGTAEGEIVINGSLPHQVLAKGRELILHFQAGRLQRATPETGEAARHLFETELKQARESGDQNWNNLAEIGLGANERIVRLSGIPLLDEKKYGSVHVALGDNSDMGGDIPSLVHCDLVCLRPKIEIDGRPIMAGGKIVLRESDWREDYRALALPADWHGRRQVAPTVAEGRVNEQGQLQRLWDTGAGRQCAVPVGDDTAAAKAAGVWRALKNNGPTPLAELSRLAHDASQEELDRLVWLLEVYGLAQTS